MARPPFPSSGPISVVPPAIHPGWSEADLQRVRGLPTLFAEARAGLERELGAPFRFVEADPGHGSRWRIQVGGAPEPVLRLDRGARLLITDGPDVAGAFETFGMLRSLAGRADGDHVVRDARTAVEAADRVRDEVANSWPSFAHRALSWDALVDRHHPRVVAAADPIPALQAWLAELGDAHTAVRPDAWPWSLPYVVHLTPERAVLHHVPEGSDGWRAGARPGMRLQGLDLAGIWATSGAPPHLRPWLAGRRALQGPAASMTLRAGPYVRWTERRHDPSRPVVKVGRHGNIGYLRFDAFVPTIEPALHDALSSLDGMARLVVDLRWNGGGNLPMARRLQRRFLRKPTALGTLRYSEPAGGLGPPEELVAEPSESPWPGPVRFLTSPRTYSAAEDLLLGLQGLPHVEVWGEPSGGGSGRVRAVRLLPGWRLTVSTALTWDRRQHLVEGQGVPVDRRLTIQVGATSDALLEQALRT